MTDANVQLGALLLSALMQADNERLPALRKQRIGRDSEIALIHLVRVREILIALHAAIDADDEEGWERVHEAWKAVLGSEQDDLRKLTEDGALVEPVADEEAAEVIADGAPVEPEHAAGDEVVPRLGSPAPNAPPVYTPAVTPKAASSPPSPWVAMSQGHAAAPPARPLPMGPPAAGPPAGSAAPARTAPGAASRPTLPFQGQAQAPPKIVVQQRASSGTLDAPSASPVTLPFQDRGDRASQSAAALSTAGYAALCAICEAAPSITGVAHTVYGVAGSAGRADLDRVWRDYFARDEAAYELWSVLRQQFLQWLARHPPG